MLTKMAHSMPENDMCVMHAIDSKAECSRSQPQQPQQLSSHTEGITANYTAKSGLLMEPSYTDLHIPATAGGTTATCPLRDKQGINPSPCKTSSQQSHTCLGTPDWAACDLRAAQGGAGKMLQG